MSLHSSLSRCKTGIIPCSITHSSLVDFLVPALHGHPAPASKRPRNPSGEVKRRTSGSDGVLHAQRWFYAALAHASNGHKHKRARSIPVKSSSILHSRSVTTSAIKYRQELLRWSGDNPLPYDEREPPTDDEQPDPGSGAPSETGRHSQSAHAGEGFFDSQTRRFSELSHLPANFFHDVARLQDKVESPISDEDGWDSNKTWPMVEAEPNQLSGKAQALPDHLKLLNTVRELEQKLAKAKHILQSSIRPDCLTPPPARTENNDSGNTLALNREDYKGLVDLYYYTHKHRSTPEAPDYSPTPNFTDDYSFRLSEDFATPDAFANYYEHEEGYESPLKEIEQILKTSRMREISVMQKFVEILVDDHSSNRVLFEVYRKLPAPGVAFLPKGLIRLFLQRMSTPGHKTGTSMLRYLSLIDDMQKAKLPITQSEWSSAIYLAGRSFGKVTQSDMAHAFRLWREMEQDAGVKASYVTFNILFDIAVRAGKYALADSILREMHSRRLRLNRLGRVSLIYYHGLRGDGDAVRKTYRDFVDAGEIVDTLVLNCVIAALMNAGEPTAAEQTYERMKDLQARLVLKKRADGSDLIYRRYPRGGEVHMDGQMASNSLGRVLLRAQRLRKMLPDHHKSLQNNMPLRPDHSTFKAMIAYHANVSGDLSRLTVLMNEMMETFCLPMRTMDFQLLFKGFALHGKSRNPNSAWNAKRLEVAWEAYRNALKDSQKAKAGHRSDKPAPSLPSAKGAELLESESFPVQDEQKRKRMDPWTDFVLDLAAFPRERRKPIERVHAELFDDIKIKTSNFGNSLFGAAHPEQPSLQETYYPLGDLSVDNEEGEYTLPPPAEAIHASDSGRQDQGQRHEAQDNERIDPDEVRITRPLVCWLLRAYARCTGSRERVERVWNSVRLLWHPKDHKERDSVLRVFRRCVKDCDTYGSHLLD